MLLLFMMIMHDDCLLSLSVSHTIVELQDVVCCAVGVLVVCLLLLQCFLSLEQLKSVALARSLHFLSYSKRRTQF
jgi:hypothetical protein